MDKIDQIKSLAIELYVNPKHCEGIQDSERAKAAIDAAITFFEEFDQAFPDSFRRAGDVHVGGEIVEALR